ncbi:MAG: phosphoglucosamine mutase [Chitinispirillaceae bacterium]|nr:phosphoglucosamine mutase [Chitinispirillaceae bacterium]
MDQLPIMSVSGIRGIVGTTFTPLLVTRIAYLQTRLAGGGKMVVGRDTRKSGERYARAAFRGIRAAGGSPVDLGIAPTPTTCVAVSELKASGGIIITASHNPNEYNGYKMVHSSGRLYRADEGEAVYAAFRRGGTPSPEELSLISESPDERFDAAPAHIKRICAEVDTDLIRSTGISVAVDSINGAAGAVFPSLLEALGVAWSGVHNKLDGDFAHDPEPRPDHLTDLSALLQKTGNFWAGFAFDPDADRLATMGEHGEAISEEMTLVFTLQRILARKPSPIATNLSTSMLIDDVAARFGVNVIRTKIGEANVVEGMLRHNCAVGGEGNGGLIYPAISRARDGLAACAIIIELMAATGKKISACAAEWPRYAIVKEKIPIGGIDVEILMSRLAQQFSHEATDRLEGLKIIRENGWVHVRPSNTEPIIRCYAEARAPEEAAALASMVISAVRSAAR